MVKTANVVFVGWQKVGCRAGDGDRPRRRRIGESRDRCRRCVPHAKSANWWACTSFPSRRRPREDLPHQLAGPVYTIFTKVLILRRRPFRLRDRKSAISNLRFCHSMEISERSADGVVILDPSGRFILSDGEELFRKKVDELIERGQLQILVNFQEITYLDSAGIGSLVWKLRHHQKTGRTPLSWCT